ncbi:hypothetical protein SAMN02745248_02517 [Hathewaya proteolytica DSM 3090]|uniref:DUF4314 domain-containing protein n=1 Tax=Hathewaya proteolytica DSM 3090 TaxID=1121331 RepID=A0A1M6SCV3_9CLOT|nr:DUF4314 domain-containing protein [Hathewaya proteolytica]SHK42561.1 hypothetical protein SAMN02745248_02517 [Hathewaya proteolytica DSM 3090]
MIKAEKLQTLQIQYPFGSRIELLQMDDPTSPLVGTKGTIIGVDDIGDILVDWDNGSFLNVVLEVDRIRKNSE